MFICSLDVLWDLQVPRTSRNPANLYTFNGWAVLLRPNYSKIWGTLYSYPLLFCNTSSIPLYIPFNPAAYFATTSSSSPFFSYYIFLAHCSLMGYFTQTSFQKYSWTTAPAKYFYIADFLIYHLPYYLLYTAKNTACITVHIKILSTLSISILYSEAH